MKPVLHTIAAMVNRFREYCESDQDDIALLLERSIWQICLEAIADGEIEGIEARAAAMASLKTTHADVARETYL